MSYLTDFLEPDNNLVYRTIVSTDTFAEKYHGYFVDTSSNSVTITLPTDVVIGDKVGVCDYNNGFSYNDCVINGNGYNIMGQPLDYRCRTGNQSITLIFVDGIQGWKVTENIVSGDISRRKNLLINGNFDVWQRGTSQTTHGFGSDDRWWNMFDSLMIGSPVEFSRQEFIPGQTEVEGNPRYFSRTVISDLTYCSKCAALNDVFYLSSKKATLSFWAKADSDKSMAIEFVQAFDYGNTHSPKVRGIGQQQIPITTVWKKYIVTVDVPSIAGKSVDYNNTWFSVMFWFSGDPYYDSETDSLIKQLGTFDLAQVQLEEGDTATEFEYRTYGEELLLCQKYFEILEGVVLTFLPAEPDTYYKDFYFKVKKSFTPVITNLTFNVGSGATFDIRTDRLVQIGSHSTSAIFSCWVQADRAGV
jgi:hypothetical protein